MKKTLLILLISAAHLFAQTNSAPVITAIDGYAAQVDSSVITYGDVRENIAPFLQRAAQFYKGEALALQIQKAYVDGREALIEEALLTAEAKALGLTLPPTVIDEEITGIIRDRFNNDKALLIQALASRRMTEDEWRAEVADRLTMRVFYSQEVLRRVNVTDEDVREEYEKTKSTRTIPFRVKYRFILINKGSTDEEKAVKKQQARDTHKKLRAGDDFAALAKLVSEGDTSESPWRLPSDVREELRPALVNTPAGEVSELIETDTVFYIVKIEGRQEAGYIPFEDVREEINTELTARERERLHNELMARLATRHYVKRF